MPDTIYTGVDCCKDAKRPRVNIHVTPSIVWATPGQRIALQALNVTRECDPACFYWIVLVGGGRLTEEFGIATTYIAAEEQEECSGSALIALFCQGKKMDEVKVGINEYEIDDPAYYTAGPWHDNYYPQEVLAGARVTDPDTLETEVIYQPKTAVVRYVPDPDYYGDTKPKVSTIFITQHTCGGKALRRNYVALRNVATEGPGGKRILLAGQWNTIGTGSLAQLALFKGNYSFADAKQICIDGWMDDYLRIAIPYQYSIPPASPMWPWPREGPEYEEAVRMWRLWRDYASGVKRSKLYENGVLDARSPAMIEGGCCSPYLV